MKKTKLHVGQYRPLKKDGKPSKFIRYGILISWKSGYTTAEDLSWDYFNGSIRGYLVDRWEVVQLINGFPKDKNLFHSDIRPNMLPQRKLKKLFTSGQLEHLLSEK